MDVMVIATRSCSHCASLGKELERLGIKYEKVYVEDAPELCQKLAIRHSPNLVVDGDVKFRRVPTVQELRDTLKV